MINTNQKHFIIVLQNLKKDKYKKQINQLIIKV